MVDGPECFPVCASKYLRAYSARTRKVFDMLDGTYAIEADSPFGRKSGPVAMAVSGDKVAIDLDVPLVGKQHAIGSVSGDSFKAKGVIKVPLLGKFECEVTGSVQGDDLQATVHAKRGDLQIVGVRIA